MQSVTRGGAKELLPLGSGTVMDHILASARAVCDQVVVVWELGKGDLPDGVAWVPQMPQRGLAPAIASGVSVEDSNLVFLPDAVFLPYDPAARMVAMGEGDIVLALTCVSDEEVSKFGICEVDDHGWVTRMMEKPQPSETESRWAICGRYRFSGRAAEMLVEWVASKPLGTTEFDLSGFFALAQERGVRIAGCFLDDSVHRFDCGDPAGYASAKEAFAHEG